MKESEKDETTTMGGRNNSCYPAIRCLAMRRFRSIPPNDLSGGRGERNQRLDVL
jgi:hypothetical protein